MSYRTPHARRDIPDASSVVFALLRLAVDFRKSTLNREVTQRKETLTAAHNHFDKPPVR